MPLLKKSLFLTGVFTLMCLLPMGCGNSTVKLHPVRGEVFYDGEPASGALVHFHPVDQENSSPAFATVEDDGTFQLMTHTENDGAKDGEYVVTVNWRDEKDVDGEIIIGPDRLGGRYSRPDVSKLRATVSDGENEISRFELPK